MASKLFGVWTLCILIDPFTAEQVRCQMFVYCLLSVGRKLLQSIKGGDLGL
jgi:hypothetical protein